jgi:nucleotidyltransferase/DNA polymerase involved in DNA repair
MNRIIFHMDMDQFFAAVEYCIHPNLRGKPIVVGGNPFGRGIVTTASYEARKYGVRSGMATSEAYKLCPQATFVRPDHSLYTEVSRRIMELLLEFTDRVEPVSVDEAYIDATGIVWKEGGVEELAMKIKRRIFQREHITATIGAGPNRLVAKMASGMNKPDGLTYIPAERVEQVFRPLPVGDLYGVGKATERILESFGIRTAGQLADFPAELLRRRFGKWGDELGRLARGEGSDEVHIPEEHPQEKSMGHDHTFGKDVTDPVALLGRLHLLCERASRRLRIANLLGRVVSVKIRYKGFETTLHGCTLQRHVQHEMYLYPVAEKLFWESYRRDTPVRLIGVHVADLVSESDILQQELFVPDAELDGLFKACDQIKDHFGEASIGFASGALLSGTKPGRKNHRIDYDPFHYRTPRQRT